MANTALDTRMLALADRLVTKFGKSVVIRVNKLGRADPATLTVAQGGPTEYTVKVSPPYRSSRQFDQAATLTEAEDHFVLLPAKDLAFDVKLAQIIIFDDYEYTVTGVLPLYSGEAVAAYELTIKR